MRVKYDALNSQDRWHRIVHRTDGTLDAQVPKHLLHTRTDTMAGTHARFYGALIAANIHRYCVNNQPDNMQHTHTPI